MINIYCKKNLLFLLYILFNASLIYCLFCLKKGYIYVSFFILSSHIRDIFSIIFQIFNYKKIITEYAEPDVTEEYTICSIIPVYDENIQMVVNNLESLSRQNLTSNIKQFIFIICDGLIVGDNDKPLYHEIDDVLTFQTTFIYEKKYTGWKTLQDNALICKFGEYNGTPVILACKLSNAGKKDTLIAAESLLHDFDTLMEFKILYNLSEPNYIYHTDCDTVSDKDCLNYLLKALVADKDLVGVSGMVRAYYDSNLSESGCCGKIVERVLYYIQDFQYYFSLIIRRNTESLLGSTICLPGCVHMIKVCEKSKLAIEHYGDLPKNKNNLVDTITKIQGTDRRYAYLLLENKAKLKMEWRASVYTVPPLSIKSFINQRRRWSSNTFFNSYLLMFMKHLPIYVRLSCLVDVTRIFATIFRFASYIFFWVLLLQISVYNWIFLGIFLFFPYIYISIWSQKNVSAYPYLLIGMVLNKIFMSILSVYIITKMLFTATNFSWNGHLLECPDENTSLIGNNSQYNTFNDCKINIKNK